MPINRGKLKNASVVLALCGLTLLMTAYNCYYPGPRFEVKVFDIEQDTPKWSPDGSQIVFSFAWNLFVVESDGSRIKRLTGSKNQIVGEFSEINVAPVIFPDGSQVAYTSFEEPHFNIKTVKLKGWFNRKRTLAKIDGNDIYPVWSPDGSRIAFLSARIDDYYYYYYHIYTMAADGSDVKSIAPSVRGYPRPEGTPVWSPDGARLAFLGMGLEGEGAKWMHLYIVGADGSDLTPIGEAGSRPAWSPDGLRIAFIGQIGEDDGLFTAPLDGSLPTKILDYLKELKGFPRNVSWSPDGAQLLLTNGRNHSYVINVVNADGSDFKTLTPRVLDSSVTTASWSPDGSRIAVKGPTRLRGSETLLLSGPSKVKGTVVLATMDPDGENVQVLVRVGFSDLIAESDWVEPERDSGMNTGRGP